MVKLIPNINIFEAFNGKEAVQQIQNNQDSILNS
jgi:hypothetical protein